MKKKATKKRVAKKKELQMTDGKDRNMPLDQIKALEELLSIGNANPYGTLDLSLFDEKLNKMTLNEMQFLASRVGLVPHSNKRQLKGQLQASFKEFYSKSGGLGYNAQNPQPGVTPDNPHYQDLMDLMAD